MTAARWATNSPDEWPSRIDQAISAGFDPHVDDLKPPAAHLLAGEGVDPVRAFGIWARAQHIVGPLTRCAHPTCRTSLTEESVAYCPHDLPFCGDCVWESGCDECSNGQPNDYRKAS